MQERQVTIEGNTLPLPDPFLVIATRNPIELEGVYKLPEAQLDRFMLNIKMHYLDEESELRMLKRKNEDESFDLKQITRPDELTFAIKKVKDVKIREEVLKYLHRIVMGTRLDDRVLLGASPRAGEHLLKASKSLAFLRGREYVIPDDVKEVAPSVLAHRLILKAEYELDELRSEDIIESILERVEVPV
jgi:MoxR-like ATPase